MMTGSHAAGLRHHPGPGTPAPGPVAPVGRARGPVGLRLRFLDLAAGIRLARAAPCARPRLAPGPADAIAGQSRHAGTPWARVRPAARRGLPRRGLPPAGAAGQAGVASPLGPRDADRCLRPAPASHGHTGRRRGCPDLHAEPTESGLPATAGRRATPGHPSSRLWPLRDHTRLSGPDLGGAVRPRHPRPRDRAPDGTRERGRALSVGGQPDALGDP